MRKFQLAILFLFIVAFAGNAQELTWGVDFNTVFDNREGDATYTDTKTFFQTRLAPEIGISMMDGKHKISGGAVWKQPIGSKWDGYKIDPTLYYRFNSPEWKFSFGFVPRSQMIQKLPNFLWCDSLAYNQANIRGALVQYVRPEGFFESYIDWRGMQSETEREAFNIVFQGEWKPKRKMFILGGSAMMNHLAKQKDAPEDQYIVDNFIVNPYVGVDLGKVTPLDSFTVKTGMVMGLTRNREFDKWKSPCGFWLDVTAEWKFLGINNTLYAGGELFPYYMTYRSQLDMGEPYYASNFYNNTRVYAYILRNWFMNLEAALDFNVAKDNFTFYQCLTMRFYIDNVGWKKRKEKHPGEYLKNIY